MVNQLKMATIDAILSLHQRKWSIRRIAKELGIHRDTVARQIRLWEQQAKPASSAGGAQDAKPATLEGGAHDAKPATLEEAPSGSKQATGEGAPSGVPA